MMVLNFQNPSNLLKSVKNSRIYMYLKLEQITQQNSQNTYIGLKGRIWQTTRKVVKFAPTLNTCQIASSLPILVNLTDFENLELFLQ